MVFNVETSTFMIAKYLGWGSELLFWSRTIFDKKSYTKEHG